MSLSPLDAGGALARADRALAGDATPADAAARPGPREPSDAAATADVAALRAAAAGLPDGFPDTWDVDALWAGVRARMDGAAGSVGHPGAQRRGRGPRPVRRAGWHTWSRAWPARAAAALLVAGGGAAAVARRHPSREGALGSLSVGRAVRAYVTGPGQRTVVQLADGSRATLAPGSTLTVPVRFAAGGGTRDVALVGEAYFEVAHDAARPFRVRAGPARVRVLGTRFGVRAYAGEALAQVVVAEGRVRVARGVSGASDDPRDAADDAPVATHAPAGTADPPPPVLTAGDVARVAADDGAGGPAVRVEHGADVEALLAWRDGWLAFSDAPLPAVLAELERWHGVHFTLGDPALARRVLTARLRPAALDVTLAVLEAALDVRAVSTDAGVRLEPRPSR